MVSGLLCGWCSCANGRQAAGRQTAADGAAQVSKNTQAPLLAYMCHIVTVIFFPLLFTHGKFRLGRSRTPRTRSLTHVRLLLAVVSAAWFTLSCSSRKDTEQKRVPRTAAGFHSFCLILEMK